MSQEKSEIPVQSHEDRYRDKMRKLSLDELIDALKIRKEEKEEYDGQHGEGNSFSLQAEREIVVLKELIEGLN